MRIAQSQTSASTDSGSRHDNAGKVESSDAKKGRQSKKSEPREAQPVEPPHVQSSAKVFARGSLPHVAPGSPLDILRRRNAAGGAAKKELPLDTKQGQDAVAKVSLQGESSFLISEPGSVPSSLKLPMKALRESLRRKERLSVAELNGLEYGAVSAGVPFLMLASGKVALSDQSYRLLKDYLQAIHRGGFSLSLSQASPLFFTDRIEPIGEGKAISLSAARRKSGDEAYAMFICPEGNNAKAVSQREVAKSAAEAPKAERVLAKKIAPSAELSSPVKKGRKAPKADAESQTTGTAPAAAALAPLPSSGQASIGVASIAEVSSVTSMRQPSQNGTAPEPPSTLEVSTGNRVEVAPPPSVKEEALEPPPPPPQKARKLGTARAAVASVVLEQPPQQPKDVIAPVDDNENVVSVGSSSAPIQSEPLELSFGLEINRIDQAIGRLSKSTNFTGDLKTTEIYGRTLKALREALALGGLPAWIDADKHEELPMLRERVQRTRSSIGPMMSGDVRLLSASLQGTQRVVQTRWSSQGQANANARNEVLMQLEMLHLLRLPEIKGAAERSFTAAVLSTIASSTAKFLGSAPP
ncbi:MAG: hypothetical protein J0M12_14650 [Deltaproteobacteria bacterium]|nr:hypothetical protein [Deltaproteobacteria bacterium]